jgi:hypothetical protein
MIVIMNIHHYIKIINIYIQTIKRIIKKYQILNVSKTQIDGFILYSPEVGFIIIVETL